MKSTQNLFIKIYAHHPYEINLNLNALKEKNYNLICIFQPFKFHQFIKNINFSNCFNNADQLFKDLFGNT